VLNLERGADLTVLSKVDLVREGRQAPAETVLVSAQSGEGIGQLKESLGELAFGKRERESSLALNARHLRAIGEAREAIGRARSIAQESGPEMVALELREALNALGMILGQITPDDVLGRVFATFCIGK
jgi:tRNA modification GTPase